MDDDEFFALGESDDFSKKLRGGGGPGGVIGVVKNKHLRFIENRARNGIKAREILIFWGEKKGVNDSAVVGGVSSEDWEAGASHEDDIAWIDKGGGKDREGGFAADGVHDFGLGIGGNSENFF